MLETFDFPWFPSRFTARLERSHDLSSQSVSLSRNRQRLMKVARIARILSARVQSKSGDEQCRRHGAGNNTHAMRSRNQKSLVD